MLFTFALSLIDVRYARNHFAFILSFCAWSFVFTFILQCIRRCRNWKAPRLFVVVGANLQILHVRCIADWLFLRRNGFAIDLNTGRLYGFWFFSSCSCSSCFVRPLNATSMRQSNWCNEQKPAVVKNICLRIRQKNTRHAAQDKHNENKQEEKKNIREKAHKYSV